MQPTTFLVQLRRIGGLAGERLRMAWRGDVTTAQPWLYPLALVTVLVALNRFKEQRAGVLALSVAVTGFYLLGRSLLTWLLPASGAERRPGVYTAVYVGQAAVLAAFYALSPLLALLHQAVGRDLGLVWLVVPAALLAARQALRARPTPPVALRPTPLGVVFLAGSAALACVMGLYSWNLGAMGLDTHSHINMALRVLDAGYLPLSARGTDLVEPYTRGFHALAALWTGMAFGSDLILGPMVKIQPFLQAFLTCLALLELTIVWMQVRSPRRLKAWIVAGAGSVSLVVYALLATNMAYPFVALSGTPRFAATAVFALPMVALLAGLAYEEAALTRLAQLTLLPTAALLLVFNPALLVLFAVVLLPLLAWLAVIHRRSPGVALAGRGTARLWLLGGAWALLVLAQDPWVVATAADAAPRLVRPLLHAARLSTVTERVEQGLITAAPLAVTPVPAKCLDGPCLWQLATASLASLPGAWLGETHEHFPFVSTGFSGRGRLLYNIGLGVGAAAAMALYVRRRGRQGRASARLFVAMGTGTLLVGLLQVFAARFFRGWGLGMGNAHDLWLLGEYVNIGGQFISHICFWGTAATCLLFLVDVAVDDQARPAPSLNASWRPAKFLFSVHAFLLLPQILYRHADDIERTMYSDRVRAADIVALRDVEAAVPEGTRILIPATTAEFNSEHWILPDQTARAVLAFARQPFIFNFQLGGSLAFNWKDLDQRVCKGQPADVRAFMKEAHIGWLYVRGIGSDQPAYLKQPLFCSHSLADLGAVFPPAISQRGQSLYRVE